MRALNIFNTRAFPELQTERLTLRSPNATDAQAYHKILSYPQTAQFSDVPIQPSEKKSAEFVTWMTKLHKRGKGIAWLLQKKDTHTMIGSVRISSIDKKIKCGTIAYELHPEHWQQGYASEALHVLVKHAHKVMELNRLEACVIGDNKASDSVLLKNGFALEGEIRHKVWLQEQFWDVRLYGRLAVD